MVGFGQKLPMQRDEQGVWTVTTGVLKPDIYTYSFSVDGATFNDPGNGYFKTSYRGGWQNQFRVPGATVWDPGPGPKGTISRHFYTSAVVGDDRDYYVYTPPDYDRNRKEPYPVLYLLHGLGDDAAGWLSAGAANTILDNLITQGKATPMIMVNTLGYGTADMLTSGRGNLGGEQMIPNFAKALLDEVMPQVEKNYRVTTDRNQRAIAGLVDGRRRGAVHRPQPPRSLRLRGLVQRGIRDVAGRRRRGGRGAGGAPPPPVEPAAFDEEFSGPRREGEHSAAHAARHLRNRGWLDRASIVSSNSGSRQRNSKFTRHRNPRVRPRLGPVAPGSGSARAAAVSAAAKK